MGRLLLFENEELVARFRPHPLAYGRRYLTSLLWLVPGAAGALTVVSVGADHPTAWGLVAFALLAAIATLLDARLRKGSATYGWFGIFVALGFVVADVFRLLPTGVPPYGWPLVVGAALGVLRFIWWEIDRMNRLHFLTSERLVIRGGVGNRKERTVPLRQVQEVRSEHGLFGQAFDYGNVVLVLGRHVRGKEARVVEDSESLRGIGHLEEVKHQLSQLVEEARLNPKDRRKRVDERRVKESMRLLAGWMRRGARAR